MAHTSQSRNGGWTRTDGSGVGDGSLAAEEAVNGTGSVGRAADALGLFELPLQDADEKAHHAVQSRDAIFRRLLALADVLATATALLVGLLAAWFAAQSGGRHRDDNIPARLTMTLAPLTRRAPLR